MQTEVHTYVGEDADGNDIERPLGSFEIGGNMFTGEKGSYLDYAKSVDETENSITEIYEVSYVQQKGMAEGFRLTLDGFAIAAKAGEDTAVTTITFLTGTPSIEVGAGYTYVQAGRTLTFTAAAPESPGILSEFGRDQDRDVLCRRQSACDASDSDGCGRCELF